MVSLSDGAMTVDGASTYYKQHYSTIGEYYAHDETPTIGRALGKGATILGLQGDITGEQFDALLHGIDPNTGIELRQKASRGDTERAGWDITLSPPKSISIQALVAGDTRLIEADRQAAIKAIQEAEACALGRRRGGKEWVQTGNIVAVMFEHYDARESIGGEHGPMPQLHHHTFITNLTRMAEEHWRGLDPKEIYKARPFIDAVYLTELANRVQDLGYRIERRPDGAFELAGYSREQIEAFSERTQDIVRRKQELGLPTSGALPQDLRNRIILETRKAKGQHDPETLKAEREALAVQNGIDLNYRPTAPVRSFTTTPDTQAKQSLDFAIRHTTNRQAAVDHRDIVVTALKHGIGATDLEHMRVQMTVQQQAGHLIPAGRSYSHPLGHYTTREMVKVERENLALVRDRMEHGRPVEGITIRNPKDGTLSSTGKPEVEKWAASKHLLPDQTVAAVVTLTTPKWVSAIEGYAGSTKTTTVGSVREFAQAHGWTVRGFGTTTGAVKALTEAGIQSQTIAKTLASSMPPKAGKELWVIDESSLLASRSVNSLLKLARDRQVERLVFVGDQKQHLAIEAGAPLRQFLADNMAVARLTTIRRQQDQELKRVVELTAAERIPEAIDLLIEQKRVTAIPDTTKRYESIAADYLQGYQAGQRTLVISPANEERKALNQTIRATLVAHNYVASVGQEHQILIPRDMTPAQLQHTGSYHEGDILYFRRGSKRQAIPKGAYLKVSAVDQINLTLEAADGRKWEWDPSSLKGVQAYTQETRTIAVGDRLQWREPDNKRRIANGQYGTITRLDQREIEVQFDDKRSIAIPLEYAHKVDLGYASTSHSSQGGTFDRVLINIDSHRSAELVNQRQAYVSISRARLDAKIYTDDAEQMRRAVSRKQDKTLALDIAQNQRRQSAGMRI